MAWLMGQNYSEWDKGKIVEMWLNGIISDQVFDIALRVYTKWLKEKVKG